MTNREFAMKHWRITDAEVTEDHLARVVQMKQDLLAEAQAEAGAPPPGITKADAEAMIEKARADAEQKAQLEYDRKVAALSRPPVDPADAERTDATTARIKTLPDILTAVHDDDEQEPDVKAFRRHWDTMHMLCSVMGNPRTGDRLPLSKLNYWHRIESRFPDFAGALQKAIDNTQDAGYGAEWAPTLYSRDMQQLVYDATIVAGLVRRAPSPAQTWVIPFSPSGGAVYRAGEPTSENAAEFTPTRPASVTNTITSGTLIGRIPWSYQFDEEAITAAVGLFRDYAVQLMAEAIDTSIINGDTTATHQDTGKSYNSLSPEAEWNGLRDIAMNTMSSATKDCSTFTADTVGALLMQGTDKYIQDPAKIVWLIPPKLQMKWLMLRDSASNLIYTRNTAMGDEVVRTGRVSSYFGSPVYNSAYIWSDTNASGIYDGTTKTKSVIIWFHRDGFLLTDRKELSVELYPQPLVGINNVIVTWRGSFDPWLPTAATEVFAGVGYNITTA